MKKKVRVRKVSRIKTFINLWKFLGKPDHKVDYSKYDIDVPNKDKH